jgi:hypothetical protein
MDVEQMEKEAEAIKAGNVDADIKSADEVVAEADESAMDTEEAITEVDTDGGAPDPDPDDEDEEMEFDTNLES